MDLQLWGHRGIQTRSTPQSILNGMWGLSSFPDGNLVLIAERLTLYLEPGRKLTFPAGPASAAFVILLSRHEHILFLLG